MNLEKFTRYPLTFGPSPITPLKRFSEHLGDDVEIYAKREDCNSGLAFGGNKTRNIRIRPYRSMGAGAVLQKNNTSRLRKCSYILE